MSAESLQLLSVIAFVLAAVMLIVAVILFFVFDIRKIIGNLSGSTARKAIKDIRQKNEMSGSKSYRPSAVNMARGKITDKITPSSEVVKQNNGNGISPITEKFSTTDLTPQAEETTVLDPTANETTILNNAYGDNNGTNPEPYDGTVVLSENSPSSETEATENFDAEKNEHHTMFRTEIEMGFTDSDEIIE